MLRLPSYLRRSTHFECYAVVEIFMLLLFWFVFGLFLKNFRGNERFKYLLVPCLPFIPYKFCHGLNTGQIQ